MTDNQNPFSHLVSPLEVNGQTYEYVSIPALNDPRVDKLPHSIRVLLECALRCCDGELFTPENVENILSWGGDGGTAGKVAVTFRPSRVVMQDFTGVPAVVDLAAMRDAMARLGGDPAKVTPACQADLVIDHSVQVDFNGAADALAKNEAKEFERNRERFEFLKWGSKAFEGLTISPPGGGIIHQVNLERLARSVFPVDGILVPSSCVGTDSHTVMIGGLGEVGWGVGGIEAESVLVGMPVTMVLPEVVGYRLTGELPTGATATDLVLTIVQNLRALGVVSKFVEFFGPGVAALSLADRATIANMAPEYGATIGFFAPDQVTLDYLRRTGRTEEHVALVEAYFTAQGMLRDYRSGDDPIFSETLELDLATVVPSLSGPKRPHDRVTVADMKDDFQACLRNPVGFKGFAIDEGEIDKRVPFEYDGGEHTLGHGDVVLAAITSCTNTSNPSVMIGAALLARNALAKGLDVKPFVKTSLAPGSGVVTQYLEKSGLQESLDALGFQTVGYGCTTCIGNSGPLPPPIVEATQAGDLVTCGVLSGNRNFEGRISPHIRANYLASPPLVVAYALTGTVLIDFETEPIGQDTDGNDVFLRDLWPSAEEIAEIEAACVQPEMFEEVYSAVQGGNEAWNQLEVADSQLYPWSDESTYIHNPPFFATMGREVDPQKTITDAAVLLNLGDSITTDHISPAGAISRRSPAARYLQERGVDPKDFNTYGSRRGNDQVMARGTFANVRLVNKFVDAAGPRTVHIPSDEEMDIFDCAMRYREEGTQLIVLGGKDYGSGSSRDWAAKGPHLQGVEAVIATSFERIHRSNLVGMGIVPLQYKDGEDTETLGLSGRERFTIHLEDDMTPGMDIKVTTDDGKEFMVTLRFDTAIEIAIFRHGGILHYALRKMLAEDN